MARTPPLREEHAAAGARFTEFGGWEMPVQFDSIREEHAAVRESVGAFDVSHMGQVEVTGPDAVALTDRLVTNDAASLSPGEAVYTPVVDEAGRMLDDTVVYRRGEGVLFVPNAGHDEAMAARWRNHRDRWDLTATVHNRTADRAMVAVQGPDAVEAVNAVTDRDLSGLDSFAGTAAEVAGHPTWCSRTGYTGEDGFEIICATGAAGAVWNALDCRPCGLGARDTLRMEMGFLLSGQDFDPEENPRTPYEAGLAWTVDLDSPFVGREPLAAAAESDPEERFAGLRLLERGVPRTGYDVVDDGRVVGAVTSGTMSPTLDEPIALGYLPADLAAPGTRLSVVIRGEETPAKTVDLPFI
jgi:aminomethyltransferase